MTQTANDSAVRSAAQVADIYVAPAWAREMLDDARPATSARDGIEVSVSQRDGVTLVSAIARNARMNDGDAFHRRALDVYRAVRHEIDATPNRAIVRMWNHIPGIHDPLDVECDRYMHFNAARFDAMCDWFNGAVNIPAHVPAASGVGDDGNDLVVHALALQGAGVPVENPRQVPAFKYSKKFGPLPPCFARATLVHSNMLLISGTAAITGELSQHLGDLDRQWELTLANLRVLIRSAWPTLQCDRDPLHLMDDVRIYVKRPDDLPIIATIAPQCFPTAGEKLEVVRADLCRTDLLVEIEGVAQLGEC